MEEALQNITDFINKKTDRFPSGTYLELLNQLIPALEEERERLERAERLETSDE